MAILFTDGGGLYSSGLSASNTITSAKVLEKWDNVVSVSTLYAKIGRHSGGFANGNYALGISGLGTVLGYYEKILATTYTTLIVGFAFKTDNDSTVGDATNPNMLEFLGGATRVFTVFWTGSASTPTLNFYSPALGANIFTLAGLISSATTWIHLEMKITFGSTTAAALEIRKNGIVVATTAATNLGTALPDRVRFGSRANNGQNINTYQDIVISDTSGPAPQNTFMGDLRVETIFPTIAGNRQEWLPTAVNLLGAQQATLNDASLAIGWESFLTANSVARSVVAPQQGLGHLTWTAPNGTTDSAVISNPRSAVTAASVYSASAKVRIAATTNSVKLGLQFYDNANAAIGTPTYGTTVTGISTAYVDVTVTNVTAPAGAVSAGLVVFTLNNGTGVATTYADTMQINAGSTVLTWTIPRAFAINENPHDGDATFVESDVTGQAESYTFADLYTTQGTIMDARPNMAISRTATGPRTVSAVTRTGGANFDSGSTLQPDALINTYKIKQGPSFSVNPGTGLLWTIAELNAAEFGPKIAT